MKKLNSLSFKEIYNTIEITDENVDMIVDAIIEKTLSSSDMKTLEDKISNLVKESEKIHKILTDNNDAYQKIITLLKNREELSKKINNFRDKLEDSNNTLSKSEIKNINNIIIEYEAKKKSMSRDFYILAGTDDNAAKIYQAIMQYQVILNDVLGQKQELYYVMQYYGKPLVYQIELNDLESVKKFLTSRYNKDTFTGAFNISKKTMDNLGIENLTDANEYDTSEGLADTYSNVMFRYKKAKEYSSRNKWIFWKTENGNPEWDGIKVGQSGDINEAYAVFFFKKKKFIDKHNKERNVEFYAMEGIKTVDATSGLLQGDISLENGRELAIKSSGASMMSFKQVITVADKISNKWKNKSVKEMIKLLLLEKMKGTASGDRHKIASALKTEEAKGTKELIDIVTKGY